MFDPENRKEGHAVRPDYIRLTEIEQAFKELKHDLAIRPIHHQLDRRIEAHIFVAFIAYCLRVTFLLQRAPTRHP